MSAERIRALGWRPSIKLSDGVKDVYKWFLDKASAGSAYTSPT